MARRLRGTGPYGRNLSTSRLKMLVWLHWNTQGVNATFAAGGNERQTGRIVSVTSPMSVNPVALLRIFFRQTGICASWARGTRLCAHLLPICRRDCAGQFAPIRPKADQGLCGLDFTHRVVHNRLRQQVVNPIHPRVETPLFAPGAGGGATFRPHFAGHLKACQTTGRCPLCK